VGDLTEVLGPSDMRFKFV